MPSEVMANPQFALACNAILSLVVTFVIMAKKIKYSIFFVGSIYVYTSIIAVIRLWNKTEITLNDIEGVIGIGLGFGIGFSLFGLGRKLYRERRFTGVKP
jgi:hypothetical protein